MKKTTDFIQSPEVIAILERKVCSYRSKIPSIILYKEKSISAHERIKALETLEKYPLLLQNALTPQISLIQNRIQQPFRLELWRCSEERWAVAWLLPQQKHLCTSHSQYILYKRFTIPAVPWEDRLPTWAEQIKSLQGKPWVIR